MTPITTESPWLEVREATEYSKNSRRRLYAEVNAGRLRAARVGGKRQLLFRREWLDEWIESQATPVLTPMRRRA